MAKCLKFYMVYSFCGEAETHTQRCHAVCVAAALVSGAKVMRCIQYSLVANYFCQELH